MYPKFCTTNATISRKFSLRTYNEKMIKLPLFKLYAHITNIIEISSVVSRESDLKRKNIFFFEETFVGIN